MRPERTWGRWVALAGIALIAVPRLAAQFPAELAGLVEDAGSRTPVPNARVRVPANGLAVETDVGGRF